jgi:CHASE2 domain-containing sensor protein
VADASILAELAPHAKIALAALAGGVVRLFLRPARSIGQTVLLLSSCVTCGYFGQPALSYAWAIPDRFDGAVGALLGLFGVSIATGLLRAVDRFNFKALIVRVFGLSDIKES